MTVNNQDEEKEPKQQEEELPTLEEALDEIGDIAIRASQKEKKR